MPEEYFYSSNKINHSVMGKAIELLYDNIDNLEASYLIPSKYRQKWSNYDGDKSLRVRPFMVLEEWGYFNTVSIPNAPRLTKRWNEYLSRILGVKLSGNLRAELGTILSSGNVQESYTVIHTEGVDGSSMEYRHESSCFWGEYGSSRWVMNDLLDGAGAIRAYSDRNNFIPDMRVWCYPLQQGGLMLFNLYADRERDYWVNIIKEVMGFDSDYQCNLYIPHTYVNNDAGIILYNSQLNSQSDYDYRQEPLGHNVSTYGYTPSRTPYHHANQYRCYISGNRDHKDNFVNVGSREIYKPFVDYLPTDQNGVPMLCYATLDGEIVASSDIRPSAYTTCWYEYNWGVQPDNDFSNIIPVGNTGVTLSLRFDGHYYTKDNMVKVRTTRYVDDDSFSYIREQYVEQLLLQDTLVRCDHTGVLVYSNVAKNYNGKYYDPIIFRQLFEEKTFGGYVPRNTKQVNMFECDRCGNLSLQHNRHETNEGSICTSCMMNDLNRLGLSQTSMFSPSAWGYND